MDGKPSTEQEAGVAARSPEAESPAPAPLDASLAAQLRLLWGLELADTPMAVTFEPSSTRA
jgi:hypothetical protein